MIELMLGVIVLMLQLGGDATASHYLLQIILEPFERLVFACSRETVIRRSLILGVGASTLGKDVSTRLRKVSNSR